MSIDAIQSATSAVTSPSLASNSAASAANFSEVLASNLASGKADFVSGRIGIDLDSRGQPAKVIYFDEAGNKLRSSTFDAENILRNASEFGIDLNDLTGLGAQLDAAGIGYRPYELYKGTGSDHGINFEDLIAGGLGTAYDWRADPNVSLKGPTAQQQLDAAQALSDQLQLTKNSQVTDERGIDPDYFEPLSGGGEDTPRNYVVFNGNVAAWYRTPGEAAASVQQYGGQVIDLLADTNPGTSAATPTAQRQSNSIEQQLQALITASSKSNQMSALDSLIASLTNLRNQEI